MNYKLIAATLILVSLPCLARGQDGSLVSKPEQMTPDELTEAVISLQGQLKQLADVVARNSSNIAAVNDQQKTMADKLQEVSDELGRMTKDQLELAGQIQEVTTQLGQIKVGQEEFQGEIADQILEVNTQLGQISRNVGGSRTLRFDNIQDDTTRKEFQELVNRTTPKRGKLIVQNKMSTGQYLTVNRWEYYFSAGEQREFDVPTGTVSTKLRGQRIVNWTVSAPSYEQTVYIEPTPTPVRTTTSVSLPPVIYQSPPVYIDPITSYVQFP